MSQLINIFLEPGKTFAELKEKPTFLLPAALLALAAIAAGLSYFLTVDPAWFAEHQVAQMLASRPEMSPAEIEQVRQVMPGARASAYFSVPMVAILLVIVFSLYALYYLLAGKVTGHDVGFRRGLSLATWASMPLLIGHVVVIAGVLTGSSQASFESMQLLNVDPLLVQLPADHAWSSIAKSFSLVNLWCWFLGALGWKTWFRCGWGQAWTVTLLPSFVIYGIWAAIVAL